MPRGKTVGGKPPKRPIERYEHGDKKRINNPPVGLVTPETDPVAPTHKTSRTGLKIPGPERDVSVQFRSRAPATPSTQRREWCRRIPGRAAR